MPYKKYIQPLIVFTGRSIKFTLSDKRKVASLAIVVLLPIIGNSWMFFPDNVEFPHYGNIQTFMWAFSINLICVLVSTAWFLTIHRRDFALQIIALAAIFYGVFTTYDTLPFTQFTPVWLDFLAVFSVYLALASYLYYIHKNYLSKANDYKLMHDGIVHDLHHQRFLGEISRIEGLIEIAEMEEPYLELCRKEIAKVKESVTYISEKYSELK